MFYANIIVIVLEGSETILLQVLCWENICMYDKPKSLSLDAFSNEIKYLNYQINVLENFSRWKIYLTKVCDSALLFCSYSIYRLLEEI